MRFPLLAAFWRDFSDNRVAVGALAVVVAIVAMAIFAPLITPQNPNDLATISLTDARRPPGYVGAEGMRYWLGTDADGRDLYSAILYGLRTSLQVSLFSGAVAFFFGGIIGAGAAFLGKRTEVFVMRLVDLQLSFPAILVALVLASIMGQSKTGLVIALVAAQYAYFARTAHGVAVAERSKEYVEAALCIPLNARQVILRHVLPNCFSPLIVVATIQIAYAISLEATLSFLGLGLPPTEPSLGLLIANGFQYMLSGRYWISIYPGVALAVLIISVNLVGDQLRDQFNPRLRR